MNKNSTDSTEKEMQAAQSKEQLRVLQRIGNKELTPTDRLQQSSSIIGQIKQHPHWVQSKSIFGFMPMDDEPDLLPLLIDSLKCGKKLCLPCYEPKSGTYKPALIQDLKRDLVPGKFGILEPNFNCSIINTSHMDLTLVPGLAFDSHGWRLGRGKGFYDRLLAGLVGVRFGIAFDHQWLESVPHETLDQKMDWIITPSIAVKASE
jgi:5-formyltetrahydrofolate cyclo-ligase